jgi:uncharacterized protein
MTYYALMYDVVDGFVDKRTPHRPAHLGKVNDAHARGDIVMAGAIGTPPEGALIVFKSDSAEAAERFARADPYVTEGLVTRWRVLPWTVVVGGDSAREPRADR